MDRMRKEEVLVSMIRSLGAALRNRSLYPPAHPLVRKPLQDCLEALKPFLSKDPELTLAIADGTLVLEGIPIFSLTSNLESFMEHLVRMGVPALIFERGVETADLEGLVRFLLEAGTGELSIDELKERLAAQGVTRIRLRPAEEPDEEEDRIVARGMYDGAVEVVAQVLKDVESGRIPSGEETMRVVKDMKGMLARNRDALLALTMIKNYDEYTYNHSVNVSVISLALADAMKLSDPEKIEVGAAGILHDVGKTRVALDLIRKPSALSMEEFEEIKKHPQAGYDIIQQMHGIRAASAVMVREHHMRHDLQGYPKVEEGHVPHPNSRIIAVADCYDALTTMRCYQKAKTPSQALEIMEGIAGKSLCSETVQVLKKSLGYYPVGSMVRLDTMEVGVVTATAAPDREPKRVDLLFDRNGRPLPQPEPIDFAGSRGAGRKGRTIVGPANPLLYPFPHMATAMPPPTARGPKAGVL
jgi:HD-GYP domain-containing protein (c-di-GMP phosphodiesterase class II)